MENLDYLNELRVNTSLSIQRGGGSDIYYNKYLKYKEKYLELKNQSGGVITLKNGIYAYFVKLHDAKQVCGKQFPDNAPSVAIINKLLNEKGYYIKNGDTSLLKIKTTLTQVSSATSNLGNNIAANFSAATQVAFMRINLAGKALYGNLTSDIVNQNQTNLKANLDNIAQKKSQYRKQKSKFTEEIAKGSRPDEIELEFSDDAQKRVFSALDEEYTQAIIQNLQTKGIDVDTILVINLSSVGRNQCLSLKTYPNPYTNPLPSSPIN
jgi:hypothetical protein